MSESSRTGVVAVGGAALVVVCCAAPAIAATGAGLALGAWLGAHGLWLLAGLVVGGVAAVPAVRRTRHAHGVALLAAHRVGSDGIVLAPQRMGAARGAELDPPSRELYHWILREMAAGRTPTATALGDAATHFGADAATALDHMRTLDLVQLDRTGAVRCAYPFSAVHAGHEVRLSGGQQPVQAMCAVDALGIPYMLQRAGEVVSADPGTSAIIRVAIDPPADPAWQPPHAVVVVGATASNTPGNVSELACPYISFFESAESAHAHLDQYPEITGTVLAMPDAVALGRAIFEGVLDG